MRLKGGDLQIDQINSPQESVAPGGIVEVQVVVHNTKTFGAGFPEDHCDGGGLGETNGFAIEVFANPEWGERLVIEDCIAWASVFGTNEEVYAFDMEAPSVAGTANIDVGVTMRDSREQAVTTKSIFVDEGGAPTPSPQPDPNPGDGDGGNGDGGFFGDEKIFGVEKWKLAAAGGATASILIATR